MIATETAKYFGIRSYLQVIDESLLAQHFADSVYHCEHISQDFGSIAKFILSDLPRQHGYKVVLTGEGADEHFGGYLQLVQRYLSMLDPNGHDFNEVEREKMHSDLLYIMRADQFEDKHYSDSRWYREMGRNDHPSRLLHENLLWDLQPPTLFKPGLVRHSVDYRHRMDLTWDVSLKRKARDTWHALHTAQAIWNQSGLPNYVLAAYGDRAEMAHSLEARPPFLDHVLTEYVNNCPPSMKVRWSPSPPDSINEADLSVGRLLSSRLKGHFTEKYLLREAVKPFVPEDIYRRNKQYYSAPLICQSNGPMQTVLDSLLTKDNVDRLGFVEWDEVNKWKEIGWRFAFPTGEVENVKLATYAF